jgi:3-methylcrotonyl-CoA carboxylase alpha subunit
VIMGVTTNINFLRDILQRPEFVAGELSTHFVDDHMAEWAHPEIPLPDEALIAAAISQISQKVSTSSGGQPDGDAYSPWSRMDGFRLGTYLK